MKNKQWIKVEQAKAAATEVLLFNLKGNYHGLPRTAAWGYPEPYTRDLLLAILGVLTTQNPTIINTYKITLEFLANNQSLKGHIPSMVHDAKNKGASDTTPLFLMTVAIFRKQTNEPQFLENAIQKAITWMDYQSPTDDYMIAQQPTSDWRDELWVIGYGLYVNTITYISYQLLGYTEKAERLKKAMQHFIIDKKHNQSHYQEGMVIKKKP